MAIPTLETVYRAFQHLSPEDYLKTEPSASDYDLLIDSSTRVVDADTGRTALVFAPLPRECVPLVARIRKLLQHAKGWGVNERASGIALNSLTFGYMPRLKLRNQTCRLANYSRDADADAALRELARVAETYYATYEPALYAEHRDAVQSLDMHYRYSEVFTSGVINKDSSVHYHYDRGNLHGAWSAMLYLCDGIEGGETVFPEYRLAVAPQDAHLVFFAGSVLIHGVSPFRKVLSRGTRYTIVYYTLRNLWHCLPPPQEYQEYLRWRTEYEERVAREGRRILSGKRRSRTGTEPAAEGATHG